MKNNGLKFIGVDVLNFLGNIMKRHTMAYMADFDMDTEMLIEAANSVSAQDRRFIWLCRTLGTWLLSERNVFLTETRENNTLCFYEEQTREPILAYAVEVVGKLENSVSGNVYTLDYTEYYHHVKCVNIPSESVLMKYELGEIVKPVTQFSGWADEELGQLTGYTFYPKNEADIRALLAEEKRNRERFRSADTAVYLAAL